MDVTGARDRFQQYCKEHPEENPLDQGNNPSWERRALEAEALLEAAVHAGLFSDYPLVTDHTGATIRERQPVTTATLPRLWLFYPKRKPTEKDMEWAAAKARELGFIE